MEALFVANTQGHSLLKKVHYRSPVTKRRLIICATGSSSSFNSVTVSTKPELHTNPSVLQSEFSTLQNHTNILQDVGSSEVEVLGNKTDTMPNHRLEGILGNKSNTLLSQGVLKKAPSASPEVEVQHPEVDIKKRKELSDDINRKTKSTKRPVISGRWREIQGANDWEGLLDHPIDACLRAEIIRYGEFAQACYDAFDANTYSKYCGKCKYKESELFDKVGLPGSGYEITKYLYATMDPEIPRFFKKSEAKDARSRDSNWIGYIAVATCEKEIARLGRRDILVAWRGTVTSLEWMENLKDLLVPAGLDERHTRSNKSFNALNGVKVERGFLHLYTCKKKKRQSAREQLLWGIHDLVGKYKGEQLSITVTGHSLGGALALLSGYDIAESGMDEPALTRISERYDQQGTQSKTMDAIFESLPRPHNEDDDPTNNIPITVFSFSAPRVGNDAFRDRCKELRIRVLRIVNDRDLVPRAPGIIFNENCFALLRKVIDDLPWTYSHVGKCLELCSDGCQVLQQTLNPVWHHNLEALLYLVDGYQGRGKEFASVTDRDPALVNKAADFLKSHLGIPPFWWQEMHKGLVRNENGRWVHPVRDDEDEEYEQD